MNIFNSCSALNKEVNLFKEHLIALTPKQKKIAAIALIIFSFCLICLSFYRYFKNRTVSLEYGNRQKNPILVKSDLVVNEAQTDLASLEPNLSFDIILLSGLGKNDTYHVSKRETIQSFKKLITQKDKKYTEDQIKLVWNGKQLEDDKTFEDYHLSAGDSIRLILTCGGLRKGKKDYS